MVWPFKNQEQERRRADAIIHAVHNYYALAKKRFPGKEEIFYLALAWAIHAKKHHAEQYRTYDLSFLIVAGSGDTGIFSLLDPPDSIDALGLYMIHKEGISVVREFEPRFNAIMARIKLSEAEAMRRAEGAAKYVMAEAECLQGLTEDDFKC